MMEIVSLINNANFYIILFLTLYNKLKIKFEEYEIKFE